VTEADGNSPKAIKSTLKGSAGAWILNGAKKWTTLGPDGSLFFVAARDEAASTDRPGIRVARVLANSPGLNIQSMPETRFVPEVPHAQLQFENVKVEALLPGDGYDHYVKPFRTVEDIHVQAAILAYLMREAQRLGWPEHWIERLSALLAGFATLSDMPPSHAETHVGLAGALAISTGLIDETDAFWEKSAADPAATRWSRDRELLKVAGGIRAQRTKRAWEKLRQAG